jgi:hypothetical protein
MHRRLIVPVLPRQNHGLFAWKFVPGIPCTEGRNPCRHGIFPKPSRSPLAAVTLPGGCHFVTTGPFPAELKL